MLSVPHRKKCFSLDRHVADVDNKSAGLILAPRVLPGFRYKLVFTGISMVDWILEQDFAFDRESAEELGRRLLLHGCFTHVTNEHHFYDEGYFYRFNNLNFLEERFRAIESDIARGQEYALTSSSAAADNLRSASTSIRHRTTTLNMDGRGGLRASPGRPFSNAVV